MDIRIQCLCIDTADPAGIASFWESALGWRRTWADEGQVWPEPPAGSPEDGIPLANAAPASRCRG